MDGDNRINRRNLRGKGNGDSRMSGNVYNDIKKYGDEDYNKKIWKEKNWRKERNEKDNYKKEKNKNNSNYGDGIKIL